MTLAIPIHPAQKKIDSTKLTTYMRCPRRFFFEHVLGWRTESDNFHLAFGAALHEGLRHLQETSYCDTTILEAVAIFNATFVEQAPALDLETCEIKGKKPRLAKKYFTEYVAKYPHDHVDWKFEHLEVAGSVPISRPSRGPERLLYYRLDALARPRKGPMEGALFDIDHKTTGSMSKTWIANWESDFALGTYYHVMHSIVDSPEEIGGIIINGFAFLVKETRMERLTYTRSPSVMGAWLWNANRQFDELDHDWEHLLLHCKDDDPIMQSFPQRPTSCSDYGGCPFHDFCFDRSFTNPLQQMHSPPPRFKIDYWDPENVPAKTIFHAADGTFEVVESKPKEAPHDARK